MHCIHRHLIAIRAPHRLSSVCPVPCRVVSLLSRDVPIQRVLSLSQQQLALCHSVRHFTQNRSAATSGQAALPVREADDDGVQNATDASLNNETGSNDHEDDAITDRSFPRQSQQSHDLLQAQSIVNGNDGDASHDRQTKDSSPYLDQLPLDEDEFAVRHGFWSLRDIKLYHKNTSQEAESEEEEKAEEEQEEDDQEWRDLWVTGAKPNKIDLSQWKPSRGERKGTHFAQWKLANDKGASNFRDNRGPRKMVAHFLDRYYWHVSSTKDLSDEAAIALLNDPVLAPLENDVDRIVDIMTWSWIVAARPDQRFKRLTILSRLHDQGLTRVPQWLMLQMLRSDRIQSTDFVNLFGMIEKATELWCTKVSAVVLVVRLIRHARSTSPTSLCAVVEYFMRLLRRDYSAETHILHLQDRTHWCNRVLRLLAIPTASNPFMHARIQQDAQLLMLHYMYEASHAIPLNREGYRALVMLQLMHEKTETERAWATKQAETWPPWEKQHQMGTTSEPRTSLGSTSRVNTVLLRMREDGYSPYTFDVAAQILGGRDSDASPTTQVRRKPSVITIGSPWLPDNGRERFHIAPQIWAARITATRTVREAWMGFCAYERTSDDKKQSTLVYLAMFQKLWAKTLSIPVDGTPLPGDGLETFPDPELFRDRVHVPEEPPSPEELYTRMRARDIRPSGRLLNQLLQHERDLSRGLAYISESTMRHRQGAILAHPMLHEPAKVARQLLTLHPSTVKAYIGLLSRPNRLKNQPKLRHEAHALKEDFSGPRFAFKVMRHGQFSDPSILTEYLAGLSSHLYASQDDRRREHITSVWRRVCDSLTLNSSTIDCSALPHVFFVA